VQLAENMEVRIVKITDLREQEINAQVMAPREFERLTENIRQRGALESLPYVAQPGGEGPLQIVSGHHRTRAARLAGLEEIPVIVDTSKMTRSQIVAKQIAHNALVGHPDEAILRELAKQMDAVDDLLASGLPDDFLPVQTDTSAVLGQPHAAFDWRNVTFTFLPHQLEEFQTLIDRIEGSQDLVGVAPIESYEPFAEAVGRYQRIRDVRSIGTTIGLLTRVASDQVAIQDGKDDTWVAIETLFGRAMPASAAGVVAEALRKAVTVGDTPENHPWQWLEQRAAEYLAEA